MAFRVDNGTVLLLVAAVSVACGDDRRSHEAPRRGTLSEDGLRSLASKQAIIGSIDVTREVPTILWVPPAQGALPTYDAPEAAARNYLVQYASHYRLSGSAVRSAYVHQVHDTGRGGIIVTFRQRVAGIEVIRNELDVLMTRDLRLVGITGNLHEAAGQAPSVAEIGATFRISHAEALAAALSDLYKASLSSADVSDLAIGGSGYRHLNLRSGSAAEQAGIHLAMPARVKQVFFPLPDRLVPAHFVEFLAGNDEGKAQQGYAYFMAADDGRVLLRRNLMAEDVYSYRVWADPDTGIPADGPQQDYTPHPTRALDALEPEFVPPSELLVEGLRHPGGLLDSWLVDAVETEGNNVDAYADHYPPDGFTPGLDLRARVLTDTQDFHYDLDLLSPPLATAAQTQAAVVQLFYTTNWLHDYFYTSGFDEPAGNAQNDNYGRGGLSGDALLAEAQDLGPDPRVRNNADIFVPADGMPPRMQMFLWNVPDPVRSFTVATAPAESYPTGMAAFGPQTFDVFGPLVLANDGVGSVSDGCEAMSPADVANAIVLVERGNCLFEHKTLNAERANAVGLIVINHVPNVPPPDMFDEDASVDVEIPTMSVSREAGLILKERLGLTASMARRPGIERDGTIDNTIVAHEWGHLLHMRLVDCATYQCLAQSEGWADFVALLMMVREGDVASGDYDGTYAIGIHAGYLFGGSDYYGVRRAPYSRDFGKNGLMFGHVTDDEGLPATEPTMRVSPAENSESHNSGEVWAAMLFDAYIALLEEAGKPGSRIVSFEDARRRMADYMIAGMKLAPVDPTFTEQRDALLMATLARDPADMLLLASAFARRGAGSCAVSPARGSADFIGVQQDIELRADMGLASVRVDDSLRSCDGDGILDAEERGRIEVTISNPTAVPLSDTEVIVSAGTSAVLFPGGASMFLDEIPPFSSETIAIPIAMNATWSKREVADLQVMLSNDDTCARSVSHVEVVRWNHDLTYASSDSVEGERTAWTSVILEGENERGWYVQPSSLNPRDRVWFAEDGYNLADLALESPTLKVSEDQPLEVRFEHRYAFAHQKHPWTGQEQYWNGSVIELSLDDGQTWEDASSYADTGYGGMIETIASNPLAGRMAFVAENPSWPAMDVVTIDFGESLAGRSVKMRFRLGTDWFFLAHGWEIDDIQVRGINNQPFLDLVDDAGRCNPIANAGADQTVSSGALVSLDASDSSDPNGDALTYAWTQICDPPQTTCGHHVALNSADNPQPTFQAPMTDDDMVLTFDVQVGDGESSSTDSVKVTVRGRDPGNPSHDAGMNPGNNFYVQGGGCTIASSSPQFPWLLVLGMGVFFTFLRYLGAAASFARKAGSTHGVG